MGGTVAGVGLTVALALQAFRAPSRLDFEPTRVERTEIPPRRIASLVSEADEMILGLVGPERMVCATYLSTIPESSNVVDLAAKVPVRITHIAQVEPVILLEPDLVVVDDFNRPEVLFLMERAGLRIHRLRYPRGLEDVKSNLRHLGRVLGEEGRSEAWIREIDRLASVAASRLAGREKVRTLVLSGAFWAEGKGTLVDELVRVSGGRNVVEGPSRVLSPEEILLLSPQVVVMSEGGLQLLRSDPALASMKCRCYVVPWREAQPASQFVVESLKGWARRLSPELFEDWK